MIISASRRTDIPAFYPEWFSNRIKEGFVYVRNPMNYHAVSKIMLNPDVIDCIFFITKNPGPMLPYLDNLRDYKYYFNVTVNPYNQGLEAVVPRKKSVINSFQKLSDSIGPKKVIWRYDPVFFTDEIDFNYHLQSFESIAKRLSSYTDRCILGFINMYKKTARNMTNTSVKPLNKEEMITVAVKLKEIADAYNITIQSCSETVDFTNVGIIKGNCIDQKIIERVAGYPIETCKDKNQRPVCRCIESIDIGEYDSCPHECLYCYANNSNKAVKNKLKLHDPTSPFLIGNLTEQDVIKERRMFSFRQSRLFPDI